MSDKSDKPGKDKISISIDTDVHKDLKHYQIDQDIKKKDDAVNRILKEKFRGSR